MKKLIGTLVAAMLAAAVFADVGVGAWGRGVWTPFIWDGEAKMGNSASWGGGPRVGVSLSGSSDNFGFGLDIKGDGGDIAVNDNANIWTKPWDWLKIEVGRWFDDTLRGSVGFGSRNWIRCWNTCVGDDATFARIHNTQENYDTAVNGALLALTPVDGLFIAAAFDIGGAQNEMVDTLTNSQYVAGYTIADVMAIKAQYIGNSAAHSMSSKGAADMGTINAAVDLLMIENNKISLGGFIPLSDGETIDIAATYSGSFDAASLNAYLVAAFGRDNPFGLQVGIGFEYDLGDGKAIEADVRTALSFDDNFSGSLSVGAYFSKGFSNGKCGIGVMGAFGLGGADVSGAVMDGNNINIVLPIKLEYWF